MKIHRWSNNHFVGILREVEHQEADQSHYNIEGSKHNSPNSLPGVVLYCWTYAGEEQTCKKTTQMT